MGTASYSLLTMWKLPIVSTCGSSINTVPDSKNLVNPSGTEARGTHLKVYAPHQVNAPLLDQCDTYRLFGVLIYDA
jgi:hypothetical protein